MKKGYLHGYSDEEQRRLVAMNQALNPACHEMISLQGHEKVLDLGCGLGIFAREIAHRLPTGHVEALEYSSVQLDKALSLAAEAGEDDLVTFTKGSARELDKIYPPDHFDLIFTRFLLEHLKDPEVILAQCFRALKPGGIMIIIDDDHANYRISPAPDQFSDIWGAFCQAFQNLGHDPYIGRKLISLLYHAGFDQLDLEFVKFGGAKGTDEFDIYSANLEAILQGAKDQIVSQDQWDEQRFLTAMAQIKIWRSLPDAALWYPANFARARRPLI